MVEFVLEMLLTLIERREVNRIIGYIWFLVCDIILISTTAMVSVVASLRGNVVVTTVFGTIAVIFLLLLIGVAIRYRSRKWND